MIVTIFFASIISLVVLMCCALYSISIYRKALKIRPYKLDLETVKAELDMAQNQLESYKGQLADYGARVLIAEGKINEQKAAERFLAENAQDIQEKQARVREVEDEIKEVTKKLDEKNEEYNEKLSEYKDLLLKSSAQDKEFKATGLELNMIKEEKEKRENEKKEIEVAIENLKKERSEIFAEIEGLKISREKLNREIEELKKQKDELRNKIDKEIDELKKQRDEVKNEIDKAKDHLNELTDEQKEKLDKLKNDLNNIEDAIKKVKEEQSDTTSKVDKAEGRIQSLLESINTTEETKWKTLDTPIIQIKKLDRESYNEHNRLEIFKNALKESNIVFDSRMVNAFHTGLKVQDISPLVVLAGISGTGKTLLPKLYAQAMGMNFLAVAVQPRWDSPQDMLGFYNYMQGKYSATELSRLLWQFDLYNNPNMKDKTESDLPMNIVLLDEMNLARVEYYFSDLLSKLELRRTVDVKDSEDRAKAEIEIEGGESGGKLRRLFVGGNTLFVGTMNEDETTQSLSDKVMDRSNVLRFGKPKDIKASPDIEKFNKDFSEDQLISYKTWKGNFKSVSNSTLNASQKDQLSKIISDLNNKLDIVNRPFAYRVSQSIEEYVVNYPNVSVQSNFIDAISDQIEMKILPKLNGLEKSDKKVNATLNEIDNILSQNKLDEDLRKVFNGIKDDTSNVFFQWKGIPR